MPAVSFYYDSTDGIDRIHAMSWKPANEPVGVLQITHGMTEHIKRYDEFAQFLCDNGWLVVGSDHLGHGASVSNDKDFGYFSKTNPANTVVEDLHSLFLKTKRENTGKPYFLLGHSMGSFAARSYIGTYGNELDGAVIMGSCDYPLLTPRFALLLTRLKKLFQGERHRSAMLTKMTNGSFNRRIAPLRTPTDWLTRDSEIVDKYNADKACTFIFTLNGFEAMFGLMIRSALAERKGLVPKELPLLITSGEEDPVGNYGAGPKHLYESCKRQCIADLQLKLYPEARHEILNETNRQTVYADLLGWLNAHAGENIQA